MTGKPRVLDVGNCNPDRFQIRNMLERHFDVDIDYVMHVDEALAKMRERQYALVLFNRLIFEDESEGLQLVHRATTDAAVKPAPMMMLSNFADRQSEAVAAGAVPGFGKAALTAPGTIELVSAYLPRKDR